MTLIQLFMVSTSARLRLGEGNVLRGVSRAFVPYVYMESGVLKDFREQISELYNLSPEKFYFQASGVSSRVLFPDPGS